MIEEIKKIYPFTQEDYEAIDQMAGGVNAPQNAYYYGLAKICQQFEDEVDMRQVVGHGGEVDDSDKTPEETEAAILAMIKPKKGRMDSTHSIKELEPDEGRLLHPSIALNLAFEIMGQIEPELAEKIAQIQYQTAILQRDLTASIKDTDCQARMERIKREIDEWCDDRAHQLYNGDLRRRKSKCSYCLQALWEKEGVK